MLISLRIDAAGLAEMLPWMRRVAASLARRHAFRAFGMLIALGCTVVFDGQMRATAQVEVVGVGVNSALLDDRSICWKLLGATSLFQYIEGGSPLARQFKKGNVTSLEPFTITNPSGGQLVRIPCAGPGLLAIERQQQRYWRFYVGVQGGGVLSGTSAWNEPGSSTGNFNVSGGLIGAKAGWYHPVGPFLMGLEAGINATNIRGSTNVTCATPCETRNTFLITVLGEVGYPVGSVVPFATAGLAIGNIQARVGSLPGSNTTNVGWAAGGGVTFPLGAIGSRPIVGSIELLYVDLRKGECGPIQCGGTASIPFSANILTFGIRTMFDFL
jgi:hypothetical protein